MISGKKPIWTQEEELQFLKNLSAGKNLEELAIIHNRSVSALELRLKKIVYDNILNGTSQTSLALLLKIPEDKIVQYCYEYKCNNYYIKICVNELSLMIQTF